MQLTQPKPRFSKGYLVDPKRLTAGRYGTEETISIWGSENTFEKSLRVQGQSALTLSNLYPKIVPRNIAEEIAEKASLKYINPDRIRYFEEKTGHDVHAINMALEEVLSQEAKSYVNKIKTSADTTQPAKALQIKESLEVVVDSIENLRDITLEKAKKWIDIPFMATTHLYDALPTVAGRPFVFYAETLQSDLENIKYAYDKSIKGKWADATGDHHSAKSLGIDGIKLQKEYCKDLGIGHMIAPAQIPSLEFEADIVYSIARTAETMGNMADFITLGKSSDGNVLLDNNPRKRKGSSAMPHKDIKGGNPTAEEQVMSLRNKTRGLMTTALSNCQMPYARNLAASADCRIDYEDMFIFFDHCNRRFSSVVYWLGIDEERSRERVNRSFGVVTSENVMTHLTDIQKVDNPMPRSEAHNLVAELATEAYMNKTPFFEVLKKDERITDKIEISVLKEITDPFKFIGESKRIVNTVFEKYHKKKTL